MRSRAQRYRTLDGLSADRDAVPWYWKMVAMGSSFLILGGYLMLPATFYNNTGSLRVSQAGVGIFAVALLTAGFSLTGLSCFAVRNALFQADSVFLPALTSSCIGLLTVFYDFLVFSGYSWNTPALLTTIVAAISTVIYGVLLIYTQRKVSIIKSNPTDLSHQMDPTDHRASEGSLWQEPSYYENYVRNMFPSSARPAQHPQPQTAYSGGYDPNSITEDEMQRQQMLMLLLQQQPSTPMASSSSTYNIDWQGRDDEEAPPPHGYYAPGHQSPSPAQRIPHPGLMRQFTNDLQPWDGVWRAPARVSTSLWQRPTSREIRETRRREIESNGTR